MTFIKGDFNVALAIMKENVILKQQVVWPLVYRPRCIWELCGLSVIPVSLRRFQQWSWSQEDLVLVRGCISSRMSFWQYAIKGLDSFQREDSGP